jgi:hypothetical protein
MVHDGTIQLYVYSWAAGDGRVGRKTRSNEDKEQGWAGDDEVGRKQGR